MLCVSRMHIHEVKAASVFLHNSVESERIITTLWQRYQRGISSTSGHPCDEKNINPQSEKELSLFSYTFKIILSISVSEQLKQ